MKLHPNPNVQRFGLPIALMAVLLGGTACKSDGQPRPAPTETSSREVTITKPSCAATATVLGRTATVKLDVKDGFQPGLYAVEEAEYQFGDGAVVVESVLQQTHTYANPGSYAVSASIIMDVAPGAEKTYTILHDGATIPCTPTTVTIG